MKIASERLQHLNAFMNGLASVVRIPPPEKRPCDLRALVTYERDADVAAGVASFGG